TYLYVAAFAEGGQTAAALKSAYQIPAGDVRVKAVTRLFDKLGMSDKCKKAVGHYSSKALKALNATSLSEENKEAFRHLAEKHIGTKKCSKLILIPICPNSRKGGQRLLTGQ
ncbi:MAG: hypothetical protein K2M10_09420, partial [Muribaculaceae bacterium]|nr:hypothetical protein [Muribaculaceae bacterium]